MKITLGPYMFRRFPLAEFPGLLTRNKIPEMTPARPEKTAAGA